MRLQDWAKYETDEK
jgi:hypothetical protein